MPRLNGQPAKDTLRKEIRELNSSLRSEQKQRRDAQLRLKFSLLKIKALEDAIAGMGKKAQQLLSESAQDFESLAKKKLLQSLRTPYSSL